LGVLTEHFLSDSPVTELILLQIPELENFLRILRMEEQQYQWQIRQRYHQYRLFCCLKNGFVFSPSLQIVPVDTKHYLIQLGDYDEYGTGDSMVVS
uniref:SARAH domain-containing protein n=1 Tax=Heligmosomoides polygyrus TaxID=6339 RepID=A0A183GRV1_HELPZ